jgi:aminoglycoside phosphotransferase (APT) family kinase protein
VSRGREWTADVELDAPAVRRLVGTQFPDVSLDGLRPFATGWDNALWVTGEGIAFRFPRRSIAVPGVEREIAVLPALAPRLPLPVPDPEWIGHRDDEYPWPFFGTRLLPGREIADAGLAGARDTFGASLGRFLRALHDPTVRDALGGGLPHDPNERADMAIRVPKTRERLGTIERLGLWHAPGAAHAYLDEAETLPPPSETALVTATSTSVTSSSARIECRPRSSTGAMSRSRSRPSTCRSTGASSMVRREPPSARRMVPNA